MNASFFEQQLKTLMELVEGDTTSSNPLSIDQVQTLPISDYVDLSQFEQEKALFKSVPLLIGHSSQVANIGDYFTLTLEGISFLITRADDKKVKGFYNYCQHRGSRLISENTADYITKRSKRFVCPYHAWSYDHHGDLKTVPRQDLFPGLDCSKKHLKPVQVEEKYGLLWLTVNPQKKHNIEHWLGGFNAEFAELKLADYHLYYNKVRPLNANWKLPLDAFLESYHISVLHRNSIAAFFLENVAHSEQIGPHIRSFVPRSNYTELKGKDWSTLSPYDYVTPSHIIFPNVCFIFHPTSISIIAMLPGEKPDQSAWHHLLLTPQKPTTEKDIAHYNKTIQVIDGLTYEKEDFWISEQIQQGLNAGAIDEITLGDSERMIYSFHQQLKSASEDPERFLNTIGISPNAISD